MPLTREQTKYQSTNDTVFLPTVAVDSNLGVRGNSVFDGTTTFNNNVIFNSNASFASIVKTGGTSSQFLMADGSISTGGGVLLTGGSTVTASAIGVIPIVLKGASGQIASLQEWQNNSAQKVAGIGSTGTFIVRTGSSAYDAFTVSPSGNLYMILEAAATQGINIQTVLQGHTGNLQSWSVSGFPTVRLAADLSLNSGAYVQPTAKTAAYTPINSDINSVLQMNGAFAFNIDSTLSQMPIGTTLTLVALTAGVTIAATNVGGSTVPTLLYTPGLKLRAANSVATAIKMTAATVGVGASTWIISGDLTA